MRVIPNVSKKIEIPDIHNRIYGRRPMDFGSEFVAGHIRFSSLKNIENVDIKIMKRAMLFIIR